MINNKIFLNGIWVDQKDATINVYDHGILYGDGVYEGIRAYNGRPFKAKEHIIRLRRSAKAVGIKLSYSDDDFFSIFNQGLEINDLENAYFRVILTRGVGGIGPDPETCSIPSLVVIVEDIPLLHNLKKTGITTALSTIRRSAIDSLSAQIKSLNYLSSVLGKQEAIRIGVDDVVMLNDKGFVTEAPVANIFLVQEGCVITPNKSSGILEGITRNTIIGILRNEKITVIEADVTPFDLTISDEMFLCGTHAEIVPIIEHNGIMVGQGNQGELTKLVYSKFNQMISEMI